MAELPQSELLYIIALGSLGMLSLVVGFAVFIAVYQKRMLQEHEKRRDMEVNYQKEMIQAQIESQENERKRIAADLHDSIGSQLWAAKLNMAFLGRMMDFDGESRESYNEIMIVLDESINSVKRISWELTPEAFQQTGLSSSVKELCERLNGKGQSVVFTESGEKIFWKDERALMLFRIIQELVNNAVKHANANTITVNFSWDTAQLVSFVSDDGIGFKLKDEIRKGVGWWNIENRSTKIGAIINQRQNVRGTAIELIVPLLIKKIIDE